jgi:hypothetical protein
VKVLLAFILIVTVGAMWETARDRPQRPWPLIVLCAFVAAVFFKVVRVL